MKILARPLPWLPLALVLCPAGCRSSGLDTSNLQRLLADSIPRQKASSLWCGNSIKLPGTTGCSHKADHGGTALEHVEVRGWITWAASFANNADPDFHYDLELDPDNPPVILSGPSAGQVIPLHHLLHPGNIIEPTEDEGESRRALSERFRYADDVYVGNNLKIEIHGWFTSEEGRPVELPQVPLDWVQADDIDGRADIVWPFHPLHPFDFQEGNVQVGDYVRLVGTLWEDSDHDLLGDWDDVGGHGWFELHPVDLMARFNTLEPQPRFSNAVIVAASGPEQVTVRIGAPKPRPPDTVLRYEEVIKLDQEVTHSVSVNEETIDVTLDGGDLYWAYYRVYWESP